MANSFQASRTRMVHIVQGRNATGNPSAKDASENKTFEISKQFNNFEYYLPKQTESSTNYPSHSWRVSLDPGCNIGSAMRTNHGLRIRSQFGRDFRRLNSLNHNFRLNVIFLLRHCNFLIKIFIPIRFDE